MMVWQKETRLDSYIRIRGQYNTNHHNWNKQRRAYGKLQHTNMLIDATLKMTLYTKLMVHSGNVKANLLVILSTCILS